MPNNYADLSFQLGLRKMAGLRGVAPAIRWFDSSVSEEVYVVEKNKQIHLSGCEMTPLEADCIKIRYKSSATGSYNTVKNYYPQTSYTVTDTTDGGDILYTKIVGSPTMPRNRYGYETSYFTYKDGATTVAQEFDTQQGIGGANLLRNDYASQDPIGINNYNFSRSITFKETGYFEIILDEAQSALYKATSTNTILTNPDAQSNYNSYKTTTRGPWTPVDHSAHPNGSLFKRKIIIKCVENFDVLNSTTIIASTDTITSSLLESAYTPNTSRTINRVDLTIQGTNYTSSINKYFIETSSLSSQTMVTDDKNITINSGSTYKVLRNKIFNNTIFNGSGDFVKVEVTAGVTTTVDMRNSTFINCKFKNITFGTKDFKQLILDGSKFFNCEFINCKFYIRPQNIIFNNCYFNNHGHLSGLFFFNGSDGNVFIDCRMRNITQPFYFDNSYSKNNINNLIYRVYCYDSINISNRCSFIKVINNDDGYTPGVFVGNIVLSNYVARSVGDPIVIESSASLNLFTMNYFESSGSVKLGSENTATKLWAATWLNNTTTYSNYVKTYTPYGRVSANSNRNSAVADVQHAIDFFNNNSIPENRRVIIPNQLQQSYADNYFLTLATPNYSIDETTNTADACKNSSGTTITQDLTSKDPRITTTNPRTQTSYGGTLTFPSPWSDNAHAVAKSSFQTWLNAYKTAGGKISYIAADVVDSANMSPVCVFSNFLRQNTDDGGQQIQTHIDYILNDPRATSTTVANASVFGSLIHQLKLDTNGGYVRTDFNTRSLTDAKGAYKLWDFVTSRITASYVNDLLYTTSKSIYPDIKVSNYDNFKLLEEDKVADLNGHKSYFNNDIGTHVSVHLYGEWIGGNSYKISQSDSTVLDYEFSTTSPFGSTSWNAFLVSQQKLRAVDRNRISDGKKFQVWLASPPPQYSSNNSFGCTTSGVPTALKYWTENAYHALLRNPDPVLYWNANSVNQPAEVLLDNIITEVNNNTYNRINSIISSSNNKINYNTNFIVSGCKTNGNDILWRITVRYDQIDTVIINGNTFNLNGAVGLWYRTNINISNLTLTSYNSSTKTLTLNSSI